MAAKHPTGKHLKAEVLHDNKSLLIFVVKGTRIEDMPYDDNVDYPGEMLMALPELTSAFDRELDEMLSEANSGDVLVLVCPTDSVFTYGYSRVKTMIAK
ncbi:hypothetical protein ED28_02655 [[Pantoea] beijingensis]|uniref:Uncharacterized protein n=1 Tax=[Pantoea] beijingensis TaxID=1324864 RepID=A0A443IIL2_9GAMM|nr:MULTISPECIES: hypothetical protein [Erwiniaceae]RWR03907.1 hypothetical protein ED28_02655 [[Pantoea] beijingensis]